MILNFNQWNINENSNIGRSILDEISIIDDEDYLQYDEEEIEDRLNAYIFILKHFKTIAYNIQSCGFNDDDENYIWDIIDLEDCQVVWKTEWKAGYTLNMYLYNKENENILVLLQHGGANAYYIRGNKKMENATDDYWKMYPDKSQSILDVIEVLKNVETKHPILSKLIAELSPLMLGTDAQKKEFLVKNYKNISTKLFNLIHNELSNDDQTSLEKYKMLNKHKNVL